MSGGLPIYPLVIAFGALCMLLGFVLIARGVGGEASESSVKMIGIEIHASRVGPGVVFALFGLVLTLFAIGRLPANAGAPTPAAQSPAAQSPMPLAVTPPAAPVAVASTAAAKPDPCESASPDVPCPPHPTAAPTAQTPAPPSTDGSATYRTSYDCAKAATWSEMAICHNQDLAEDDVRYHDLYRKAEATDLTGEVKARGVAALKLRAVCGSVDCLKAWYDSRIAELKQAGG